MAGQIRTTAPGATPYERQALPSYDSGRMTRATALLAWLFFLGVTGAQAPERPPIEQIFKPGDQSQWVFESEGKRIGEHASRFLGPEVLDGRRAEHFQGSLRLQMSALGAVQLSIADLWTDGEGRPLRYVQEFLVGTAYSRVEIDGAGKNSKARVVQGSTAREIPLEIDPAAFLLANNFVSHLEIYLALRARGEDARTTLFSANALQGLTYAIHAQSAFEETIDGVPTTGEVYQDSLGERLRVSGGRLIDVEVPSAKLVIRRSRETFEPVRIVRPEIAKAGAGFDTEDVRIEREGARIAGTITRPKGSTGRLPAAFFVSGSGTQDRQGFSSGLDLGTHEILDRITAAGFLVLRVDDRGAGESSNLPPNASFLDLVADARACLDYLLTRDDVDPARIVLLGHSEGGETVPILAAERPSVAAVVLLAAPGRPVLEIIADQNRLALERQGLSGNDLERQLQGVRAFLARLASDEAIDPVGLDAQELAALNMRAWLQSHARQDPLATIRKVRCPVLILQGALDFQVSPELDAKAIDAALTAAGHQDHELHIFEQLDHLFKRVPGERSELADYWTTRPVDPQVLDTIAGWLQKRLVSVRTPSRGIHHVIAGLKRQPAERAPAQSSGPQRPRS